MNLINSADAKRETILEVYRQVCADTRAYMELRFKHFGTFVVLTTLLGALAFNFQPIKPYRPYVCLFAIGLTVLFWLLDYRTSLYHRTAISLGFNCQTVLESPFCQPPKLKRSLPASLITNLIFATILLFWIMMCGVMFLEMTSTTPGNAQTAERPSTEGASEKNKVPTTVPLTTDLNSKAGGLIRDAQPGAAPDRREKAPASR
ncbi:MAG: hypothetical protein SWO11_07415 [Thermodesulfobacteriota bacterium]|nr:hypothetical protein [Thermodesulfobacteriota bacterium]